MEQTAAYGTCLPDTYTLVVEIITIKSMIPCLFVAAVPLVACFAALSAMMVLLEALTALLTFLVWLAVALAATLFVLIVVSLVWMIRRRCKNANRKQREEEASQGVFAVDNLGADLGSASHSDHAGLERSLSSLRVLLPPSTTEGNQPRPPPTNPLFTNAEVLENTTQQEGDSVNTAPFRGQTSASSFASLSQPNDVLRWWRRSVWKISILVPFLIASVVQEEHYYPSNDDTVIVSGFETWLPFDELMSVPFTLFEYADSGFQEVFLDDYVNILLGIHAAF